MNAQAIGAATAVVGSSTAALALLLNWHRGRKHTSRRVITFLTAGILAAAAAGLAFSFRLSQPASGLTEGQYRAQATQLCSNMRMQGTHEAQIEPQKPLLAINIDIEHVAVDGLSKLQPPPSLKHLHEEAVSTWEQRLSVLTSVRERELGTSSPNVASDFAQPDSLAEQAGLIFEKLKLPQCDLTK